MKMEIYMKMLMTAVFLVVSTTLVCSATLPDYMTVCSRSDPDINVCIKNSVHSMRPYLKDGIPSLNVPPMEPLDIGDLNILEGGPTGINVKAKRLLIYGASNFEIKKIKNSDNLKRFDFELSLPHLHGDGHYNINGQILALPIKGSGPFTGNFTNFYAFVKVVFDIKNINDVDYISIKDLTVRIRTGSGNIRLQNLFGGDKALGDVINDTINQNFEVFTNEMIGPIEKALEKKFKNIASKILENFTFNELFPV